MQLRGPPTFNGTKAPYPTEERPLEAAFQPDTDVETYVKTRSGGVQRTSERAYRARFRFVWAALTYQKAHDLLSAASQHPVTVAPRTRAGGEPASLQETAYDCRVVEELSGATPLFRRDPAGNRLARVTLVLESLDTYFSRPPARKVQVENAVLSTTAESSVTVTVVGTVTISVAVTQVLSATDVGVTRTGPPSRTVSAPNGQLQASAAASVAVTIPPVIISASTSQALSATAVGVTRSGAGSRTVSVSNALLEASSASGVSISLPAVTISASTSQALSATSVGVSRTGAGSRTVTVSNAVLQTSAASSVTVASPTVPIAASTKTRLSASGRFSDVIRELGQDTEYQFRAIAIGASLQEVGKTFRLNTGSDVAVATVDAS